MQLLDLRVFGNGALVERRIPTHLAYLCLENFEKFQQRGEVDCIGTSVLKILRGLLCFVRNSITMEAEALADTSVEK